MPFEQRHDRADLVDEDPLLGRQDVEDAGLVVGKDLPEGRDHAAERLVALPGQVTEQRGEPCAQVPGEPRRGRELQRVGLLVQRHPEAEVVRVDAQLTLDVQHVGGHQQQPSFARGVRLRTRGRSERVELAEHLAGEQRQGGAELRTGGQPAGR